MRKKVSKSKVFVDQSGNLCYTSEGYTSQLLDGIFCAGCHPYDERVDTYIQVYAFLTTFHSFVCRSKFMTDDHY